MEGEEFMGKRIDITGMKFGDLTAIEYAYTKNKKVYWKCLCTCGNETIVRADGLKSGAVKSCGKHNHYEDLTGVRSGRLEVIQFSHKDERGRAYWKCRCDCGNESIVRSDVIKSGYFKSCGCYSKENIIKANQLKITHGKSKTRLYNIWRLIKQRCYNPKASGYKWYGKKGVKMDTIWKNNFELFYEWAQNNGYEETLTIDRLDADGDYTPNNCRWITQSENTRRACEAHNKKEKLNV